MATGGYLSGGKFPTLSIASSGFLFTDLATQAIDEVTARFLDSRYASGFDSDLYDSIFNDTNALSFADNNIDAEYLKNALSVKYEDSTSAMYNDNIVTSSIKKTEITTGIQASSALTSYRVSGVKVGFN